MYDKKASYNKKCDKRYRNLLRDIAVFEVLFSTGVRVSELCKISEKDIDVTGKNLMVNGKGNRERLIPICTKEAVSALKDYYCLFKNDIRENGMFFLNRSNRPLSDQSVRRMINKYLNELKIEIRITPHMFRHSVATMLLERGVDIRYIQNLLGHSSINTTQIYAHVRHEAQRRILTKKHPRQLL